MLAGTSARDGLAARRAQTGDRFAGKYLLSRRIAVGGMGEIWVARNEMTGADVALKVLRADVDRRGETEARFRHEAQLGATLTHRNIVRVFDLLMEPDGTLILVMELLRGVTLRRAIALRSTPYAGQEAVAILLPVLSALDHAHAKSIVHRDLKPANIVLALDPDGHVTPKLLDFGIAKVPNSDVRTLFGRVLGTPRYMSPEQIRAEPKIDGRSDVFSAATLLIEMLTGASPFRAATPSASLAAVLEQEVDPDPRIDPKLWLAIRRALAKRAYERYATAAEFATALRQAVGLTDAELSDVLQKCAPPSTSGEPSFLDLSPTGRTGESADGDDDDGGGDPLPDFEPAPGDEKRRVSFSSSASRPSADDTSGDASLDGIPMAGRRRRGSPWTLGLIGAAALLTVAGIGLTLSGRAKPSSRTVATTVEEKPAASEPLPSNIPPPPPVPEVVSLDTASATSAAAPTKNAPGKSKRTEKKEPTASDKPGKKKPVARTPDF